MIDPKLIAIVETVNRCSKEGTALILSDDDKVFWRENFVRGFIYEAGVAKYGKLYAIMDTEERERRRQAVKSQLALLDEAQSKLRNMLMTEIHGLEDGLEPEMVELQEMKREVLKKEERTTIRRNLIRRKLVELRCMGYSGIESKFASVPSLTDLSANYGIRVKSYEDMLEKYESGEIARKEAEMMLKLNADEVLHKPEVKVEPKAEKETKPAEESKEETKAVIAVKEHPEVELKIA